MLAAQDITCTDARVCVCNRKQQSMGVLVAFPGISIAEIHHVFLIRQWRKIQKSPVCAIVCQLVAYVVDVGRVSKVMMDSAAMAAGVHEADEVMSRSALLGFGPCRRLPYLLLVCHIVPSHAVSMCVPSHKFLPQIVEIVGVYAPHLAPSTLRAIFAALPTSGLHLATLGICISV